MDIKKIEFQIKHLIKSNLISTGLQGSQIEEVVENLYHDIELLITGEKNE